MKADTFNVPILRSGIIRVVIITIKRTRNIAEFSKGYIAGDAKNMSKRKK